MSGRVNAQPECSVSVGRDRMEWKWKKTIATGRFLYKEARVKWDVLCLSSSKSQQSLPIGKP